MATTKPQQRGSIIDAKDLRYFIRIASKNWYFVVVALLLSAVLSYLYSYKLPDIHGATTQILLKDNEVYDYQSQMYKSLGYVQSYSDIVNQKRVITSYDLIDATLDKLDFDISYFIVGRFKTTQGCMGGYRSRSISMSLIPSCTIARWISRCWTVRSMN